MKAIWQSIVAWFKAKGGVLHVLAGVYAAAALWYASSPAFQQIVTDIWGKLPHGVQLLYYAVTQIMALYGLGAATKSAVSTYKASKKAKAKK